MGNENLGNKDTKAQVDARLENLRRSFCDSVRILSRFNPGISYVVGEVPKWKDGDFEKSWEMRENDFKRAEAEVKRLQEILNKIKIEFEIDALRAKKIG